MDTITSEVVSPMEGKLIKYAGETGLEKTSTETLVEAFRPIFAKGRTVLDDARGVAESVKDATCVTEIRKARSCRLAIRAIRLESDEARKKHKQHALLYGRAVDGFHNILMVDLSPVETALQEAEDTAERAEAARKAEAEAKAKTEADRIERERIAAENRRLKEEAIAREAAAKAEREAAEKAARVAAEKEREAREKAESEAKRLREAEADRQRAEQESARKAAAAPDREKLITFAAVMRTARPSLSDAAVNEELRVKTETLAIWSERRL